MDFDSFKELLLSDRTVRRFHADKAISPDVLTRLVDLTRYCASGRNAQPLRYRIVTDPAERDAIYPALAWAGYYKDWDGPAPSERPVAYLIQCLDTTLGSDCLCDDGLQLQAITLGARTLGISSCIIKAFNPAMIAAALNLPAVYRPRYVLALGYPAEEVRIVDMQPGADFRYYRDEADRQCVPKRPLSDLIIPV